LRFASCGGRYLVGLSSYRIGVWDLGYKYSSSK
jgi:hypothetical protein